MTDEQYQKIAVAYAKEILAYWPPADRNEFLQAVENDSSKLFVDPTMIRVPCLAVQMKISSIMSSNWKLQAKWFEVFN